MIYQIVASGSFGSLIRTPNLPDTADSDQSDNEAISNANQPIDFKTLADSQRIAAKANKKGMSVEEYQALSESESVTLMMKLQKIQTVLSKRFHMDTHSTIIVFARTRPRF